MALAIRYECWTAGSTGLSGDTPSVPIRCHVGHSLGPSVPLGYSANPPVPRAHPIAAQSTPASTRVILRVQVGSGVHGTSIDGQDDRDEMGLCLEPAEYVTGLARVPAGTRPDSVTVEFEQYERHTVWDQPGGLANRSGAGDLDVIIYSARKWCRLALAGNPTVMLPLSSPTPTSWSAPSPAPSWSRNADRLVSRIAAERYLGYLSSQRAAMTGQPGGHTNRPELVALHGYDTKYAMQALRLGVQGVELLTAGRITLPVPEPARSHLRAIRSGDVPLDEVIAAIDQAEADLKRLAHSSAVSEQPTGPGSTTGSTARTPTTGTGRRPPHNASPRTLAEWRGIAKGGTPTRRTATSKRRRTPRPNDGPRPPSKSADRHLWRSQSAPERRCRSPSPGPLMIAGYRGFCHFYNYHRSHGSLGWSTPAATLTSPGTTSRRSTVSWRVGRCTRLGLRG